MSAIIHEKIALELDFPKIIVKRALRKYKFKDAGSFVDYLETHMEEFEVEEEAEEPVSMEKNITILTPPEEIATISTLTTKVKELSLKEETEILYHQTVCLECRKNKRSFVCLPCCHFTLCETCESQTRHCPLRSCREHISATIQTYGL